MGHHEFTSKKYILMENTAINQLLDRLILSAADKKAFTGLSAEQKAIAALAFFLSTMTRSGAVAFFNEENSYLYQDVEKGFSLLKATESLSPYQQMLSLSLSGNIEDDAYSGLQEEIISKLFTEIHPAEEKYVETNFKSLSEKL